MTYASCAKTVKSAISEVKGVKAIKVDLKSGEVEVGFDVFLRAPSGLGEEGI